MTRTAPVLIREALPSEVAGWDRLVRRFHNHRVTHTTAWMNSLEASGLGRPLYLLFERDGDLVGCLPGLVAGLGPLRIFGSPMPGWQTASMGPAFDPDRVSTGEMLGGLTAFLERRCGVHHIELLTPDLDGASMQALGFRGEQTITCRGELFPGDEARTLRMMKDSARRNVRRGERLGLIVRFEDDDAFVAEHYDQIGEVFARGGNVVPFRRRRLAEFVRHMRTGGYLAGVSVYLPDGRTCIATGTFTIEGTELLLWMWAHRTSHRWYRPTELMTWAVMRRAMEAGCVSVDFMGRGDFKAVFGAVPDSRKYRWVRSRIPFLTQARDLAQRGFRWQQGLRGRLARMHLERSGALDAPADAHAAAAHDEASAPPAQVQLSPGPQRSNALRELGVIVGGLINAL